MSSLRVPLYNHYMKITTKTGDKGETGLFRSGRVSKSAEVIEVLGEIDELQSFLGWCKVGVNGDDIAEAILKVQDDLYRMMSIFGGAEGEITEGNVAFLEEEMANWKEAVEGMTAFVKPGVDETSSRFHVARSVCRRVERRVVKYFEGSGDTGPDGEVLRAGILKYLNRLSDLLFVWAVK